MIFHEITIEQDGPDGKWMQGQISFAVGNDVSGGCEFEHLDITVGDLDRDGDFTSDSVRTETSDYATASQYIDVETLRSQAFEDAMPAQWEPIERTR